MEKPPIAIRKGEKNRCSFLPVVLSSSVVPSRFVTFREAGAPPQTPLLKNIFFKQPTQSLFLEIAVQLMGSTAIFLN